MVKIYFFKALAKRFRVTLKLMDDLLLNGLHEKVMICYLNLIRCKVCQENLLGNGYWPTDESRGA